MLTFLMDKTTKRRVFDLYQSRMKEINTDYIGCYKLINNNPMRLYKYMSMQNDYDIANIENNTLTITCPLLFNDISDSSYFINTRGKALEEEKKVELLYQKIGHEYKSHLDLRIETAERRDRHLRKYMTENARICSLSEDPCSLLMWAHYGNQMNGLAVEYCFDDTSNHKKLLYPVIYSKKPYDVTDLSNYEPGNLELACIISLITKSLEWSYEKEWRLIIAGLPKMKDRDVLTNAVPSKIVLGSNFFENWLKSATKDRQRIERLRKYALTRNVELSMVVNKRDSFDLIEVNLEKDLLNLSNEAIRKRINDIKAKY